MFAKSTTVCAVVAWRFATLVVLSASIRPADAVAAAGFTLGCMTCFGGAIIATLLIYVGTLGSPLIGAVVVFTFSLGVAGGTFHVAGNGNGAKSAFRVAILLPQLVRSVTAPAGFPPLYRHANRLRRLRGIRFNMFVGKSDPVWMEPMLETGRRLEALGLDLFFRSLPRNGHLLPDLSLENGGRTFDRIAP